MVVRARPALIVVHRWVGLVITVFLLVAGLTGSVMAFYPQLDALLNPELYLAAPPTPDARPLDPLALRDRVQAQLPADHEPLGAILQVVPGRTVNYWIDDRETFAEPYAGRIVGSREFGDVTEGRKNLLTFLYRLHYTLALGDVGVWLMGLVALLWTIDCFVGAYLTLPPPVARGAGAPRRSWPARWAPAWLLNTSKLFSTVFTWHRASGLWVWGLLLVFAWSAVALNLDGQVYKPVMDVVWGAAPSHDEEEHDEERNEERDAAEAPRPPPRLDLRAARERARGLMAELAAERGFEVIGERWIDYDADHRRYHYTVESSRDIDARFPDTSITLDADDGRLIRSRVYDGATARETLDRWLVALHFGAVRSLGLPYRIFVCVLGFLVGGLAVTGVWIWWRKRAKRRAARP